MNIKKWISNAAHMIAIPVAVYIILKVICVAAGAEGFGTGSDLTAMLRNAIYTGCIAIAVSYNLTSGRFDFAVGATIILAVIFGGKATLALGLSGILGALTLLVISVAAGALLGAINGGIYVALRLPPMVSTLGACMLFEAIGYVVTGGSGVSILGRTDLSVWATGPWLYLMIVAVIAVLAVVLNYTQFGYNTRSLRSGQEITVNQGVNEKKNAVLCFSIAGAMLAIAGVIYVSIYGKMNPQMGLSSISYIESAFLPMFIGNLLEKYGDRNLGVLMGAVAQAEITAAFGRLGVSSSWQSILSGLIVIAFFAYSGNIYRLQEARLFRAKRERALAARQETMKAEGEHCD